MQLRTPQVVLGTALVAALTAFAPAAHASRVGFNVSIGGPGYGIAFGDAPFAGSLGGRGLDTIVGMTPTATHAGYWLTTETGGLYAFGDAPPMA